MNGLETFLWGFAGSLAVEIVNLNRHMEAGRKLPKRYSQRGFWLIRLLLAIVAGGLAIAYNIDNPLLAANIGAATPLIVQALAQGVRPPGSLSDGGGEEE